VSFSCRIRQWFCSCTIRFEHVFIINKQFHTCTNAFPNEFTVRSYEYCACQHWNFTGFMKIKQRRISFVLGYLPMILWTISTAINIKHRILATFDKKKKNQFWQPVCMPLIHVYGRFITDPKLYTEWLFGGFNQEIEASRPDNV
jgi:hypothetical protein